MSCPISRDGRRIEGTDIGPYVYQVAKTCYSNWRKYQDNYDQIKWEKEDVNRTVSSE